MRERDLEKKLVDGVRKTGGRAYKFVSPGNDGVPDRIVVLYGRIIFVELKTLAGKLTRLQSSQITRLRILGQDVRVLYGETAVEDFVEECRFWQEGGEKSVL